MAWLGQLNLQYAQEAGRTVARHQHSGPLRVLQSLYPEGPAVCHNVLVHPPGGLVGGDRLHIEVAVDSGAHGLITTPGATRFYRSEGELAVQYSQLQVADGGRLEWLPLEALCYSGCQAENRLLLRPQPGGEILAWDVTALGLPQAQKPFVQGQLQQHLEFPGHWLERARIAASDQRLLDSHLGLAGHRCLASLVFATGSPLSRVRRQCALDAARAVIEPHALVASAAATCPNDHVVVVRVLAPLVEPATDLLRQVWASWRAALWQLSGELPRIWAT